MGHSHAPEKTDRCVPGQRDRAERYHNLPKKERVRDKERGDRRKKLMSGGKRERGRESKRER